MLENVTRCPPVVNPNLGLRFLHCEVDTGTIQSVKLVLHHDILLIRNPIHVRSDTDT